jgi:hypothetical protein
MAVVEVTMRGTPEAPILDFIFPEGIPGPAGGLVSTSLVTNTDLDGVLTAGAYSCSSSVDAATSALMHLPMHESGSLYVTYSNSASIQIQMYVTNTKSIYVRRRFNSVWNAWRHFGTTRTDLTAGRAMYAWDDANSREQLIYGDTGVRNVYQDQAWLDGIFNTGLTLHSSNVARVRRTNNVVELLYAFDKSGSGSVTAPSAFPLGFRPASTFVTLATNSSLATVRTYHPGGTGLFVHQSLAAQLNVSASFVYTTTDPWPTSLPGVAIGTIPNL